MVLLTPDDDGCIEGARPSPRVQPNVLFDLGYLVGRLGQNQVYVLKTPEVESFAGVITKPFDEGGVWRQSLAHKLQAAGFAIDWNQLMGA